MREIVLTGSVPLRPAANVFAALAEHLGDTAPFYPDDEQVGWVGGILGPLAANQQLERAYALKLSETVEIANTFYTLKFGVKAEDLKLGPFLLADNAIASYAEFKRLKGEGVIPPATRFEVTVPAAGMLAAHIHLLPQVSFPIAAAALWQEIERVLAAIPAEELLIQFDVPNETSFAEYERRPWAFNIPYFDNIRVRFEDGVAALALLANQIPHAVQIGIHTCSAWHIDTEGGQDNHAIVEISNAYLDALKRPLRYIHIPIHPTQTKPSDFAPFRNLALRPGTALNFGLINLHDGFEGAAARVAAAERAGVYDFGVSFWCGLGYDGRDICLHPFTRHASRANLPDVLALHKRVASL